MRELKEFSLAIVTALAIIASVIGGVFVYFTEPWYDDSLVQRLGSTGVGYPSNSVRDDSQRIVGIFPQGMSRVDATGLLASNGFMCITQTVRTLECKRTPRALCSGTYEVMIFLDDGNAVTDSKARSSPGCPKGYAQQRAASNL